MSTAAARTLRVLHVLDSEGVYGAESVMLDLCTELQRMGHRPLIVSMGAARTGEKPLEVAARARSLEVRPLRMAPGPNPWGALALLRLARAESADVVHTHGYKGNVLLGFLPKRWRSIPLVTTVHGYTDVAALSRLALYNRLDRIALRRIDRVVLVHEGMAATPGLNRLDDPRWRVIENGIRADDRRASITLDPGVARACTGRTPLIGAIGRLSPEKGFDVLLHAVRDVLLRHERAAVVILGEGPERGTLERLSTELGIADRVFMTGYVSHAREYLRLFQLFVLSSLTEGLPITVLEAMQSGVPIVATRVGGVPSVLDNGRGGALVQPGDAAALGEAIAQSLDDPQSARTRAAHAQRQSSERFSSEAMAHRYAALYDELTRHHR